MPQHNQMVLGDIVWKNAKELPDKMGVLNFDTGERFTFQEFYIRTNKLANGLLKLGNKKGDRIGLLGFNNHQYLESMFACWKAGLVIVPLNVRLAAPEISFILNNAEATTLIYDREMEGLVQTFRGSLETVKNYILVGEKKGDLDYNELLVQSPEDEPPVEVYDTDLAALPYTAGTTGKPKGVMLTHRNEIAQITEGAIDQNIRHRQEVHLAVAPMFHLAVWAFFLPNIYCHNSTVTLKRFDPAMVCRALQDAKVTTTLWVPAMIITMLDYEDCKNYDLSSLRIIYWGAATIPPDRLAAAMKKFGCDFIQGYGMTESSPWAVTVMTAEDHRLAVTERPHLLASCGRPALGALVRVVDGNDRDVNLGEVGEIIVRGNNIMQGYWKNPEANNEALKGGWYHTGDLAKQDEEGYLYIVDRKKDMYISGGENVYTKEVEDIISQHPAVFEVAIVSVPDEKWGEAGRAFISCRPGKSVTEDEIRKYMEGKLAHFKMPRYYEFVDSIPRNAAGKILKTVLREPYWKGYERRVH